MCSQYVVRWALQLRTAQKEMAEASVLPVWHCHVGPPPLGHALVGISNIFPDRAIRDSHPTGGLLPGDIMGYLRKIGATANIPLMV